MALNPDKTISKPALPVSGPVLGAIAAIVGTAMFSTKPIFVKFAYASGSVDAITLLALRMGIALPIYLVIGFLSFRKARAAGIKPMIWAVFNGLLGYFLASYLDFMGLLYIEAYFERLILFTYPFFVVLLGYWFFEQNWRKYTIPALLLAYGGLGLMFLNKMGGQHSANIILGCLLVLLAALSFALFQLFGKPLAKTLGVSFYTSIAMLGAAVGTLAYYALSKPMSGLVQPWEIYTLAGALAVFATVIPTYLMNYALTKIGADGTAMTGYAGPVFTGLMAAWLLSEPFGPVDVMGTLCVIVAIYLFSKK